MRATLQDVPFDMLLDAVSEPVVVFREGTEGARVSYVNAAYEALFQRSRDTLIGSSAGALLAAVMAEDRQALAEAMGRRTAHDVRLQWGSHPLQMRLRPLPDRAWAAILHDDKPLRDLEAELVHRANRDGLTGLLNKGAWTEHAERHFAACIRYRRPLALLMLDLDHFKQINDTHGHAVGDAVLHAAAEACRGVIRRVDVLGRVGGEELALLAPETGMAGATTLGVRLCNAVRRLRVTTPRGEIRVTASAGVAERSAADLDLAALLARADAAMYRAKAEGRDRVVLA